MTEHYDEYKGSVCDFQVVNHMTYQSLQLESSLITDPPPTSSTNISKKKQMWHLTCDMWHMVGVELCPKCQSPALMVWDRQCLEYSEQNGDLMT